MTSRLAFDTETVLEPGAPPGATIDQQTGDLSWQVPQDFPAGTARLVVRATEISAQGQPGLSSVQAVDVTVLDSRVVAAVPRMRMSGLAQWWPARTHTLDWSSTWLTSCGCTPSRLKLTMPARRSGGGP